MRTTLTIIIAIAISLAIGVQTVRAQSAELYACTNKSGTQAYLVADLTLCAPNEVQVTLLSYYLDSISVTGDTEFQGYAENSSIASCYIYNKYSDQPRIRAARKYHAYTRIYCPTVGEYPDYETTVMRSLTYENDGDIYASCVSLETGYIHTPQYSITCTIEPQ